jgi:acyl-CoA thioester hydrolase
MKIYQTPIQVRWSDLDPNAHLRHSVYYDWGAMCRVLYFNQHHLTTAVMHQIQVGPVLFREECVFRKEIRFGDEVTIDLQLIKAKRDLSRWSVRHTIRKGEGIESAILTVEGAWIDLAKRKLTAAPQIILDVFQAMPHPDDFIWDE